MKLDSFKYYIHQAFSNIKKNRLTSVASIGTTIATMFFLGVILVLTVNINNMAVEFSRSCEIQVFINSDLSEDEYNQIGEKIKSIEYVSNAEKYTKQQIFDEMYHKLGDKAVILNGLENDNPFRDSYKVSLKNLDSTKDVIAQIKKINGVENVTDLQEAANIVVKIVNTIRNVSIWLVAILCAVAAFIVSNSIKVSVFSRRKEINIMKYIGATDWFVRWPFIIEGFVIGTISAVITFVIIWLIYLRVYATVHIQTFELLPYGDMALLIILSFLFVGMIIGAVGSALSIRKHLKV